MSVSVQSLLLQTDFYFDRAKVMRTKVLLWAVVVFLPVVCGKNSDNSDHDYYVANINFTVCGSENGCVSMIKEGRYGTRSSHKNAEGYLIHSTDVHGCTTSGFTVNRSPWIGLMSRGKCMFTEKIRNARRHNASAVIIYDHNRNSEFTMLHENTGMVAVSVSYEIGNEIKSRLHNSSVYVKIVFGRHVARRRFNTISVLFVSVSFIVLMVISLAWLVFYYVQRFRYLYARDKTERRLTMAAKKAIAKLHSRTVNKKDEEDVSENSCAVCLEGYKSGETLRTLPCNHEFHKHCIDPWLIEHRTCPMCKTNILKELGLLKPEDERLSSQENEMAISGTNEDHEGGLRNPGLVEELVLPNRDEERNRQGSSGHAACAVTPVETTSSCDPSVVKTDGNKRNVAV